MRHSQNVHRCVHMYTHGYICQLIIKSWKKSKICARPKTVATVVNIQAFPQCDRTPTPTCWYFRQNKLHPSVVDKKVWDDKWKSFNFKKNIHWMFYTYRSVNFTNKVLHFLPCFAAAVAASLDCWFKNLPIHNYFISCLFRREGGTHLYDASR